MRRTLGVCYYPEHWPEDSWARDAADMVRAGLSWVRIGEFAWSRLEPAHGCFDFDWLDRAVSILGSAGLKVVLGTPTATPPRWMLERHPDMLAVDTLGRPRGFGSRRHYCFSHDGYRGEAARIAGILADRYGKNPHVAAWQTDNEYACHGTTLSFSEAAKHAFRDWLAHKYQSIDALNRAWGNVFWSMEYDGFDQIDLPNSTVTEPNPAHMLAFRRFSSDQVVRFNKAQVEAIRRRSQAPIVHNYMGRELSFDHFALGGDLDMASWDSYPIAFLAERLESGDDHKQRFLRQGDPDFQAFHHDLYRAVGRGRWWVMEQQPGPVNWARYNPAPMPGMVRLWTWEAFAHGAETVCYFRWRQAPFAQEQMHTGLLRPDGTAAPGLGEVAQVAAELKNASEVGTTEVKKVAIVFDYASAWAWQIQPQGTDFDYFRLVFAFYRGLRSLGLSIDILPVDTKELNAYKLLVIPGLMTLEETLTQALNGFTGTILFGPRSNSKTTELAIPADPAPHLPGLDCRVGLVESLPPSAPVPLEGGGAFIHWAEELEGMSDVLLRRKDGKPAVMHAKHIRYVGGWPDDTAMKRILTAACEASGLAVTELPGALRVRETASHRFVFNYGSDPITLNGIEIQAAGVHWEAL